MVDKALNASGKEGYFFICSLLDMGDYVMTNGGEIPIDQTSPGGKSTLTLTEKHLENLKLKHRLLYQTHCLLIGYFYNQIQPKR